MMCAMIGWRVEIAPWAIIFNSRSRRVNAFTWRPSLTPFCMRNIFYLSTLCGILAEVLTGRGATLVLLLLTLVLGLYGIQRSLWLDESWVANSVNAPTLSGMF